MSSSPRPAFHYMYAGHTLTSTLPLPELAAVQVEAGTPVIPITLDPAAIQHGEFAWLHHWLDGDRNSKVSPFSDDSHLAHAGGLRVALTEASVGVFHR